MDKLEKVMRFRCEGCDYFNITVDGIHQDGWCYMFADFMPNCKQYSYTMTAEHAHHALTGE